MAIIYKNPFRIATVSSTDADSQVVIDSTNNAGILAISDPPLTIMKIDITPSSSQIFDSKIDKIN